MIIIGFFYSYHTPDDLGFAESGCEAGIIEIMESM